MDRSTDFTPFFSVEKDEIHRDFIGERSYKFLNFTPSNNGDFFHDMANHPIFSSSIEFLEFDNIGIQFLNETASTQQDLKMNTSSIKFDSSPSVKLPNNFDSLSRSEIEHMNMKQVTRENLCWDSLQNISSSSSSSQGTKFVKFKQNETPNSFAGTQENKDIRRRQLKLSKKLRNDFNHDYLDYRNNFEVENWRLSRNNFQYDLFKINKNP
ncbi:hypothetical protein G9A89_001726 [Geosiphon pyriformis]|nr:hypothetical protein G9A89_001726 [Geosiphon pyriformis]